MISFIDQFEPAALCLIASLIWAPVVLAGAVQLDRGRSLAASEVLWVSALLLAVLPTLIAPALSAAGVSLRPAKVVEISAPVVADVAPVANPVAKPVAAPAVAPERISLNGEMILNASALIYLYGVILALGAYLVRGMLFARQVRAAEPVRHPQLLNALADFADRLGVGRKFELRRSEAVSTVCVFGFFRPVILMPRDIDARLSFDDLVLMGAHELAHVKRGDATLYTFAALLRIVFWFNPFLRRIAARAELAAEQGADALVLAHGADRRRYAACFIEGLKFAAERAQIARFATPSFTPFDRQSRRDRLNAILTGEMRRGRPLKVMVALALVLAGGAAFAQAGLAVAPEAKIARGAPVMIDTREGKPMRTPFDGVVVTATDVYRGKPSLGKTVVIKHDDGRSTTFARLQSYSVKKGDEVRRGDQIGVAGKDSIVTIDTGDTADDAAFPALLASPAPSAPAAAPPLPPVATAAPAPAPAPRPSPAPLADVEADVDFDGDVDAELDGAEPPSPPDEEASYSFVSPPGTAYIFQNGEEGSRVVFMKRDGAIADAEGRELSEEEKKRFERKFRELKKSMEARKARGEWAWVGEIDGAALKKLREEAAIDAKELAELMKKQGLSARELERIQRDAARSAERAFAASRDAFRHGWSGFSIQNGCDYACREEARREADEARREAEQEREQARQEAEEEREQARREAEAEREQALAEAQAEREQALAEAEAEREEALAEAEAARQDAEEQRRQIEEEIRERAEALADAERDLAQERADLERLKAELAARE